MQWNSKQCNITCNLHGVEWIPSGKVLTRIFLTKGRNSFIMPIFLSSYLHAFVWWNILASHHLTKDSLTPWLHGPHVELELQQTQTFSTSHLNSWKLVENGSRPSNFGWYLYMEHLGGGSQQWHVSQKQNGRRIEWKIQNKCWTKSSLCEFLVPYVSIFHGEKPVSPESCHVIMTMEF